MKRFQHDINEAFHHLKNLKLNSYSPRSLSLTTYILFQAGADIELGSSTPLMEAAQEGHLELVKYLLEARADVNAQTGTGDTALSFACERGHTDVADLLLKWGADLEHESEGGRTPLMKAVRAGHYCTAKFLISKGANVNKATTNNDHTPLSLACAGGHLAIVELLLQNKADPYHKLKVRNYQIWFSLKMAKRDQEMAQINPSQ